MPACPAVVRMTRNRTRLGVALVSSMVIAACDHPTDLAVDRVDGALASLESVANCAGTAIGANNGRTLTVNVMLSDGTTRGAGALVTLVNPLYGQMCEAAADATGAATFQGVARGARFVVLLRDEVNLYASMLKIAPPHPGDDNSLVALLADAPTIAGTHQAPAVLSGAACTALNALTWTNYTGSLDNPCIMPNGNGYAVNAMLAETPGTQGTLIGLPGNSGDVIVAAVSPWSVGTQVQACAELPWIQGDRLAECSDPKWSDGPAILQAMGRAEPDGSFSVGSTGSPLVIETVLGGNGFTFFGTALQANGEGLYVVHVVPGMCRVDAETTVEDETNPSGVSPLDILRTFSTIGLTTQLSDDTDPLSPMILAPVPGTAIVGAIIQSDGGGKGELAVKYNLSTGGGTLSIKATFSISAAGVCTMDPATGTGLGSVGGGYIDLFATCAETAPGLFKLAWVLIGVPDSVDRSSMLYAIKAGRDNIDAARYSLLRGSIPFAGQFDEECPVPTSNDGRYDLGM
jgi:hypothetical protein